MEKRCLTCENYNLQYSACIKLKNPVKECVEVITKSFFSKDIKITSYKYWKPRSLKNFLACK